MHVYVTHVRSTIVSVNENDPLKTKSRHACEMWRRFGLVTFSVFVTAVV
jgi:hypothetical protein